MAPFSNSEPSKSPVQVRLQEPVVVNKNSSSWTSYQIAGLSSSLTLIFLVFVLAMWTCYWNRKQTKKDKREQNKERTGGPNIIGEKCNSKAIPIFSKSYIGDLYNYLNNLTELVLLVSKVIVEFGGCGQKEKCRKEIEEFEDIEMKVFFQNLYSNCLNYYCNIFEYGSSDTEETKCGITDTHTFGFGENSCTLFLCMRVKKVTGYFRIHIDKQKDRESTNSIKFSEHNLYLQNEP